MARRLALTLCGVTMAASVITACSGGGDGSTKAGATSAPLTLRIGTDDPAGRASEDQIQEFASHVDELSGGRIKIEPVWQAGGANNPDWDQVVARMVVGGQLDMGLIPARAWDTEGVTTMRALHAPFLVDSEPLLSKVVSSDLVGEMLAGLDSAGVTGLALLPEGLRHLFIFSQDASIADVKGKLVRAPTSTTSAALFGALGASVDDPSGDDFKTAVRNGSIFAAESGFGLASGLPAISSTASNVTLYPKVNSLVIDDDVFQRLDDAQQQMLRDAAGQTQAWSTGSMLTEATGATDFCHSGGTVALASAADIAALTNAATPVYDMLEQDAESRSLIERINAFKAEVPVPVPAEPCGPAPTTQPVPPTGATDVTSDASAFPPGVYRAEITLDALLAAGVDKATALGHAGMWTMTFDAGTVTIEDVNAATGKDSVESGVYCVTGNRVSLGLFTVPPRCGDFWSAGWTVDGDQMRFVDVQSASGSDPLIQTLIGSVPFSKIN